MNRFFLYILLVILSCGPLSAQFSIQTRYHSALSNDEMASPATSVVDGSIHYWTRLPRHRLEFYPGAMFQSLQTADQGNYQNVGIIVPLTFYPLDFVNDCDCPTFSKNAFWFQKGFFIRLVPSWTFNVQNAGDDNFSQLLGAGVTVGIDFGLSDLLTISPLIGYNQLHALSSDNTPGNYLHVGVSVLFRHDYGRRYR